MKFKYAYMSQTQLGLLFGTTSHEIGRWLIEIGLRDERTKRPSAEAHQGGYCTDVPSRGQGYCWAWSSDKTVAALRKTGYQLVREPPDDLVAPAEMTGPFITDGKHIVNSDGDAVAWASTPTNAEAVAKLLNLADQYGTLARLLSAKLVEAVN